MSLNIKSIRINNVNLSEHDSSHKHTKKKQINLKKLHLCDDKSKHDQL